MKTNEKRDFAQKVYPAN